MKQVAGFALPFRRGLQNALLLLASVLLNDPADNIGKDRQLYVLRDGALELRRLPDDVWTRLGRGAIDLVKHHTQSYSFLKFRLLQLRMPRPAGGAGEAETGADPVADASAAAWSVTRLALLELRDSVQRAGGRLVVAQGGTPGAETAHRLGDICAEIGVPCCDLLPVLRSVPPPLHLRPDGHWRPGGHRAAAEALATFLEPLLPATAAR